MHATLDITLDLLDQLPCAVLVTDPSGRVVAANAELATLAGAPVGHWVGGAMDALLPPASRIFMQTHVWPMLLRDGRVSEILLQVVDAQQRRLPVLLNCRRGRGPQADTFIWTLFAATERHRFEAELVQARNRAEAAAQALADSHRFIRGVTDAMPGPVTYWDQDLRCSFANAACQAWFGHRPEDLPGRTLAELGGPATFGLDAAAVQAALAGREQLLERQLRRHDGGLADAWVHCIPDTVDGEVRGFVVEVSDVTPLKAAETALRAEMAEREHVLQLLRDSSSALGEAQRLGQIGSWHWIGADSPGWWSPQLYTMLGLDPALPPPPLDAQAQLYADGSAAALRAALRHTLRTGEPFALPLQYLRPGQAPGWMDTRGEAIRSADGTIVGLRGTAQEITARKAQEQALALTQARLQALYESTPAMLHSIDEQGRLLNVSDAWLARLGYQRSEVIGRLSGDFLTAASREFASREVLPAFFRTGRCDDVPYQMVAKDGEVVDVLLSAILERGAPGQPARSLAVTKDVTLRRRAERALAHEHQRLLNLVDSTRAGTWEWNVQTGEVIVNERWADILGWQRDALVPVTNQFRVDIAHPGELAQTRQLLRDHFAGRSDAYVAEIRLRHRDGRWIWVEDRGRLVSRTADGRPEWMFGIQIDITGRKQQEQALRRSEQLLNRTGEVAGVGGWSLDLDSGVLDWSAQTRRIHGVGDDYQPTLESAIAFYAPAGQVVLRAAVDAALAGGEGWDLELPFVQQGGRQLQVRSVGHAEFAQGRPVRLLGTFQDVTEAVLQRRALQAAHQRMALATDSGGIGVWDIDLTTNTLTVDAWMVRLYDLPAGHGTDPSVLWWHPVHAEDRGDVAQAVADAVARQRTLDTEFRIVWADSSVHHVKVSARITRDHHGRALSMIGVSWDVTSLRRLSAELARQHELLRVTLQSIGDAVITTDAQGDITWLNPVAERMTGWLAAEARGLPLAQVFHIVNEETCKPTENPVATCLQQGKVVGLANHTLLISRDGSEYGIEDSAAPIRSPGGEVLGVVLVFHDVSEQRRLSGEMTYRATHDGLTGLVNRGEFEARLLRLLRKAHEEHSSHALLYIDLDQFKLVNDACGHAIGDQLLQQVSKLLGDAVRARDTLARLGGDEFAVILEHCSVDQAQRVAQKICDRMDEFRFIHEDRRFRIGASIGLVPVDKRWATTAAIQQAADTSCYAAKEAGRNRVHAWFDTDVAMRARQFEVQWSSRIEHALDDGGFVLFAQRIAPIGPAGGGLHAEVLLRMKNDDGTLVLPGAFLPAAERFHLINRVDRWVLGQAIAWLKALPDPARIGSLSVNLSGQSVGDRAFHAWAIELLETCSPVLRAQLCLEITETAAMTNLADAAAFIAQVRQRQVRVALDDFGAGASSFGYLKSLPVDYLKIDGQFVRDLVNDPLDDAAVRCFVDVARVVGVKTVAEFVDSPAVLQRLREIGVDYAQGYLIHRPEALDDLLARAPAATA